MVKNYYVYMLFNVINGKIYIGKTNNIIKRKSCHFRLAERGKHKTTRQYSLIHSAISKYGKDNFEFKIIQSFNSEEESLSSEKYWISYFQTNAAKYGSFFGYNLTDGGEGASGRVTSEETKKKLSLIFSGTNNPNYGVPLSQEVKNKISKAQIGKAISDSTKEKYKQRMLNNNPFLGKKHSDTTKLIMSQKYITRHKVNGIPYPNSKLSNKQIDEIKIMLEAKQSIVSIAKIFGVHKDTIRNIKNKNNLSSQKLRIDQQ